MEFIDTIKSLSIIIGIITAILTLWSAAFLSGRLSPNIELLIKPVWSTKNSTMKIIIEIENKGYIRVGIKKILFAIENINNLHSSEDFSLIKKEWLSFEEAEKIMTSSYYINPKEIIHVERLYSINDDYVINTGLQVYLQYPWYIQKLGAQARSVRQTRIYFFSRDLLEKV